MKRWSFISDQQKVFLKIYAQEYLIHQVYIMQGYEVKIRRYFVTLYPIIDLSQI